MTFMDMNSITILAEAGHSGGGFWQEYSSLMVNKAHVAFELSWEIITGIIAFPIAKRIWEGGKERAIRAHDAIYHPRHAHAVRADGTVDDEGVAA